jgi:cell division septation protein DedD
MRISMAETRSRGDEPKNNSIVRGAMDYTLKAANQGERATGSARRGTSQPTGSSAELRLGKLQVVVWLGLALGAVVGSYFVGFFSGRYVGFESARESSAGEMAKLPAPESIERGSTENPQVVYNKLNSPAILESQEAGKDIARAAQPAQPAQVAAIAAAREGRVAAPAAVNNDGQEAGEAEVEELFAESVAGGELIIGSDEGLGAAKVPDSVRMMGAGKAPAARAEEIDTAKGANIGKVADQSRSASALIDERIAKARSESAKSATAPEKKAQETGSLVRKVVPSGYFAQVAAPKKVADAENIANKLKRSGFPVVVESASVAGQNFYRVLVGPEQNKIQADRLVGQLKGESYIQGDPFIRRVK